MAFWDTLAQYGPRTALISQEGQAVSYSEMLRWADEIGQAVGKRCLVFSMCRNSPASVTGYIGFLRHRIVPVMVAEQIAPELLHDLLETYHPAYFYLPAEQTNMVPGGTAIWSGGEYTLLRLDYEQDYELADELALLLTTSGSTGSPKLVRQSVKNIEVNTRSIVGYLGITENDRAITTLPMSYTYGLSIIQTHLAQGAAVILTDATLMDKCFWTLFREQEATTFGGVPYIYEMLKKLRFARMDLPSLRYMTQAGGKLSKELAEEFTEICTKKGLRLIVMYGQTEATARMAYLPWEYAQSKAGSMGIAIPGGAFQLVDTDGNVITEPEVVGELVYTGENVTLGYAQNRFDLIKPDENHGVLHTGDMAKHDADGFYYIAGRKKRFLKLFGSRINLDEVEGLLRQQGVECACTGVDDHMDIYVTDAAQIDRVNRYIKEHTAINYNGFQVHAIDSIPRNESGKVAYTQLRCGVQHGND